MYVNYFMRKNLSYCDKSNLVINIPRQSRGFSYNKKRRQPLEIAVDGAFGLHSISIHTSNCFKYVQYKIRNVYTNTQHFLISADNIPPED